jgi:hypothetical protein
LPRLVLYDTVSNNVSKRLAKMTQIAVTPRPRYTFQRNSLYCFRYTLPPDISKVVGKQGLRYSLKTGYIKQAERKTRRLAGTVEEFISDVRKERLLIVKLSETQIQSLLDQHLRQSLYVKYFFYFLNKNIKVSASKNVSLGFILLFVPINVSICFIPFYL